MLPAEISAIVDLVARALGLGLVALAVVVAATHWAVRSKKIPPFGAWSRTVRRLSDPALRPIERSLVRRGGNPQDATIWLFSISVVVGLVVVGGVRWLVGLIYGIGALGSAPPRIWVATGIGWAFGLVILALFVRVISTWIGVSPYAKWIRPFFWLTEWILKPIRRIVPPVGMIDLSPFLAYVVLIILRSVVIRMVMGG